MKRLRAELRYLIAQWQANFASALEYRAAFISQIVGMFLNNAVYLVEDYLKTTKNPPYEGLVDYQPRAEHCWNGDHTQPNAIARLRYAQMFAPKIVERILASAPEGADLKSWRY